MPPSEMVRTLTRATADLDRLVDELESTLDADQRRLLHRVRLMAESVGAIRAAVAVRSEG